MPLLVLSHTLARFCPRCFRFSAKFFTCLDSADHSGKRPIAPQREYIDTLVE